MRQLLIAGLCGVLAAGYAGGQERRGAAARRGPVIINPGGPGPLSGTGPTLPGACAAGEHFLKTGAEGWQTVYLCTVANVWTAVNDAEGYGGRAYLRDWPAQTSKILDGQAAQAVVAWIGDSWVSNNKVTQPLRDWLWELYGNAGAGYASLYGATSGTPSVVMNTTGTWTYSTLFGDANAAGADGSQATTSDTTTPAGKTLTTAVTSFVLHYLKQPGGGQFRYKVDSGSWTTVATANASQVFAVETIAAGTTASHTLTLELVTAGTAGVTLLGVDCQKTDTGVRLHRLGVSGSKATDWVAVDAGRWQAALAALNPNLVILSLGVNELMANQPPATQKAALETLIGRIRAAMPRADVLISSQANVSGTYTYAMKDYASAQRELARAQGAAFVDNVKTFGPYADGNARGLYQDGVHPNAAGGRLIAANVVRMLVGEQLGRGVVAGNFAVRATNPPGNSLLAVTSADAATNHFVVNYTGNTLLGGATDDMSTKLQVAGSGLFRSADNTSLQVSAGDSSNHKLVTLALKHNNVSRWAIYKNSDSAGDLFVSRYNDSGSWQDAPLVIVRSNGNIGLGANHYQSPPATTVSIYNKGSGATGLTVRAGSGQGTSDLQTWQDNGGTALARLSASGGLTAKSVQLNPAADSKPSCDASQRGKVWQTYGGTGVKDAVEVCAKGADDAYAWRTIY